MHYSKNTRNELISICKENIYSYTFLQVQDVNMLFQKI